MFSFFFKGDQNNMIKEEVEGKRKSEGKSEKDSRIKLTRHRFELFSTKCSLVCVKHCALGLEMVHLRSLSSEWMWCTSVCVCVCVYVGVSVFSRRVKNKLTEKLKFFFFINKRARERERRGEKNKEGTKREFVIQKSKKTKKNKRRRETRVVVTKTSKTNCMRVICVCI